MRQVTESLPALITKAERALAEIKQLQLFGGDSLNLQRWTANLTINPDFRCHCWRIVMTPIDKDFTLPISIIAKPTTTAQYRSFSQIERVRRTDGNFEFLVFFPENWGNTPNVEMVAITYSGKATFTLTQVA